MSKCPYSIHFNFHIFSHFYSSVYLLNGVQTANYFRLLSWIFCCCCTCFIEVLFVFWLSVIILQGVVQLFFFLSRTVSEWNVKKKNAWKWFSMAYISFSTQQKSWREGNFRVMCKCLFKTLRRYLTPVKKGFALLLLHSVLDLFFFLFFFFSRWRLRNKFTQFVLFL